MSDIKLKAASGGGSISIKGPSSAGSDTDFLDTSGNLKVTGDIDVSGDIKLNGAEDAGAQLKIGASNDIQIEHDGSNSYITNTTGNLELQSDSVLKLRSKTNGPEEYIVCTFNSSVDLYHNNALSCQTSANGLAFPSGKGIDFSATSDAGGMTSELLDEYEEGTWTPTSNTGSVTVVTAHYVRIGSQVTAQAYINFPSMSGSAGVTIAGFPFATTGTNDYYTCAVNSDANAGSQIQGQFATSTLRLVAPNNGGFSVTTMSSKFIIFSITYAIH